MTPFTRRVVEVVGRIPSGKVATYGQIAALSGSVRAGVGVGDILHRSAEQLQLPWHRVINSKGRLSVSCLEHPAELQAKLLRLESVVVEESGGQYFVNLPKYLWRPKWAAKSNQGKIQLVRE